MQAGRGDGISTDRVVAVVTDLDTGVVQIGSGYQVNANMVLTARHCIVDKKLGRPGSGLRVMRLSDGAITLATPYAESGDVAVLSVTWPSGSTVEPTRFARVDRSHSRELINCECIGFPSWQSIPPDSGRNAAELHGTIRATEDFESGRLVMRDPLLNDVDSPRAGRVGDLNGISPWSGLSGALVFHEGLALGVVTEHQLHKGHAAVVIIPVDEFAYDGEDKGNEWGNIAARIGIPPLDRLPVVGAPPREAADIPRELPHAVSMIGREAESSQMFSQFRDSTEQSPVLIAISGMAGVGKTTLAVNVAGDLVDSFPDGSLYINLRGAEKRPLGPELVISRFLHGLGVDDSKISSDIESQIQLYRTITAKRRVIVILDNASSEVQVRRLLPSSRSAAIVTSRSVLGALESARLLQLSPLSLKDAHNLLILRSGRDVPETEMPYIQEIARLCGNLPLALTIAGRRLALKPHWSVSYFADRLGEHKRRFQELEIGDMSVRSALALSYEAQTPELKSAFVRLASIRWPSFTVYPASTVISADPDTTAEILEQLVDAGLLHTTTTHGTFWTIRYSFHDLLHDFAAELISAQELEESVASAGNAYSLMGSMAYERFEAGRPRMRIDDTDRTEATVPDSALGDSADRWYEAERETLFALTWQAHELGLKSVVVYLANILPTLLIIRGSWNSWEDLYRLAITDASSSGDLIGEAYTLQNLANVVRTRSDFVESAEYIRRSLSLFRSAADRTGEAYLLIDDGLAAMFLGEPSAARKSFTSSIAAFEEVGNRVWMGHAQRCLGNLEIQLGFPERAMGPLQTAAQIFRAAGELRWSYFTEADYGQACGLAGRSEMAVGVLRSAMAAMSSHGESRWSAVTGLSLADVYLATGALADAETTVDASLETFTEMQDASWTARGHLIKAEIAAMRGDKDSSYALMSSAIEVIEHSGDRSTHADALTRFSRIQAACGDLAGSEQSWRTALSLLSAEHRLAIEGSVPWL